MNTKRWISIAIVVVAVIGSLGLIKLLPFWTTLSCLVTLFAGFTAGFLFKKDIIKEVIKTVTKKVKVPVEVIKEVIKEVPVEVIKEVVKEVVVEVPKTPEIKVPSSREDILLEVEAGVPVETIPKTSKKKSKKIKSA